MMFKVTPKKIIATFYYGAELQYNNNAEFK